MIAYPARRDVEALSRRESRAQLSFGTLLWLYLDPFALFKDASVGTPLARQEALQYNRRHRGMMLVYARRWAAIALACALGIAPLTAPAQANPILLVPIAGLAMLLAAAVCVLAVCMSVYELLDRDEEPPRGHRY